MNIKNVKKKTFKTYFFKNNAITLKQEHEQHKTKTQKIKTYQK